jgi:DNA-binding NarL/FixJ family response regulator
VQEASLNRFNHLRDEIDGTVMHLIHERGRGPRPLPILLTHGYPDSFWHAWREEAARHVAGLTSRQRQVMDLILAGRANKNIAADLGISQRTVENHRALIMKRTGSPARWTAVG